MFFFGDRKWPNRFFGQHAIGRALDSGKNLVQIIVCMYRLCLLIDIYSEQYGTAPVQTMSDMSINFVRVFVSFMELEQIFFTIRYIWLNDC